MYLSTRISRLCKRSPFLSLSLSLYISVCVCVWLCVWLCVCVCVCVCVLDWYFRACCVWGGWRGLFPSWISKLFLISLIYLLFSLFDSLWQYSPSLEKLQSCPYLFISFLEGYKDLFSMIKKDKRVFIRMHSLLSLNFWLNFWLTIFGVVNCIS